jgi:hypothetical protein
MSLKGDIFAGSRVVWLEFCCYGIALEAVGRAVIKHQFLYKYTPNIFIENTSFAAQEGKGPWFFLTIASS